MTNRAAKKIRYGWGGHTCDPKSPDCNAREIGSVVDVRANRSDRYFEVRPGIVLGHSHSDQWVVLVGLDKMVCQQGDRRLRKEGVMNSVYRWSENPFVPRKALWSNG